MDNLIKRGLNPDKAAEVAQQQISENTERDEKNARRQSDKDDNETKLKFSELEIQKKKK